MQSSVRSSVSLCVTATALMAGSVGAIVGCSVCGFLLCGRLETPRMIFASLVLAAFCLLLVRNNHAPLLHSVYLLQPTSYSYPTYPVQACSIQLEFHGTVFRVTSSRGCHEDATRITGPVELQLTAANGTGQGIIYYISRTRSTKKTERKTEGQNRQNISKYTDNG